MRPHFHLITFGLHLDDLKPYSDKYVGENAEYFTSETIKNYWPYGNVVVCKADYGTAAYTARYVMKKVNDKHEDFCKENNIVPEYITMSNRPGIGANYYLKHKDLFKYSAINMSTSNGGVKFVPPRYFEKLAEKEFPGSLDKLKENKIIFAKERVSLIEDRTDKEYLETLEAAQRKFDTLTKEIKRKGV